MPAARKKRTSTAKPGAARTKRAASSVLVTALAEAAWAEADAALAEALVELRALGEARSVKARKDATELLEQALTRAARKRGLAVFGVVGAREAFDAKRHQASSRRAPKQVRIDAPGVARGAEILIKARVSAARTRRR
jgi:hypothetical protein